MAPQQPYEEQHPQRCGQAWEGPSLRGHGDICESSRSGEPLFISPVSRATKPLVHVLHVLAVGKGHKMRSQVWVQGTGARPQPPHGRVYAARAAFAAGPPMLWGVAL